MRQLSLLRIALLASLAIFTVTALWAVTTPADKSFESAKTYIQSGNDQQAVDELDHFLTSFPTDSRYAQAAFLLGFSYQKLQKPDKALETYAKVFPKAIGDETNELRARTHYQMGLCYVAKPDYPRAEQSFNNFLVLGSRIVTPREENLAKAWKDMTINAQYQRANCLFKLDRQDDALADFNKVLAIGPNDPLAPWACYMIGIIALNQRQYGKAIEALERISHDYNKSEVAGEAALELGAAYLGRARDPKMKKKFDYESAVELMSNALEAGNVTRASKQQAALSLAEAYYEMGKADKSEEAYTRALKLIEAADPNSVLALQTHLQHAHVLLNTKRYDEACKEYARIVENKKSPELANEASFWFGYASYKLAAKKNTANYHDAVTAFTRFLTPPGDKDEKAPTAALVLAYCYEDLGDMGEKDTAQKAIDTYKMILTKWRDSEQAAQAQNSLVRLSPGMSTVQIRQIVNFLPEGTTNWDITLQLAYKEYSAGNYAGAIDAGKKVLDGKPAADVKAQAAYLVGTSYHKQNHADSAIPYYQQALAAAPESELIPNAQRALVQAYLDTKDFANARDAALKLLDCKLLSKAEPDLSNEKAGRLMYLATAYHYNKQFKEAQDKYQQLATDFPKSPVAPNALIYAAQLAEKQNDFASAVKAYQTFVTAYPDHEMVAGAFLLLGTDYVAMNKYDEAIAAYKNVPETSPLADQAAYAIAVAYKSQKPPKEDEALKQFTLITTKFPKSTYLSDSWYRIGEYQMTGNHYPEAIKAFNEALKASTDDNVQLPLIYFNLASCAFMGGQYQVAADNFAKVADKYPTSDNAGPSLFWRGQALEKVDGDAAAKAAREAYLKYQAKYPKGEFIADAVVGVGRASLASKQYKVARTDLQSAADACAALEKNSDDAELKKRAASLSAEIQYLTAQSYFEEKDYNKAQKEFASVSAYKYEPWYSLSFLQVTRCEVALGDKDSALRTLKLLVTTLPNTEGAKKAPDVAKELGLQL